MESLTNFSQSPQYTQIMLFWIFIFLLTYLIYCWAHPEESPHARITRRGFTIDWSDWTNEEEEE